MTKANMLVRHYHVDELEQDEGGDESTKKPGHTRQQSILAKRGVPQQGKGERRYASCEGHDGDEDDKDQEHPDRHQVLSDHRAWTDSIDNTKAGFQQNKEPGTTKDSGKHRNNT